MAATPLQGLVIPVSSDPPNGPSQMSALAVSVESKLVQVYASSGARTSAFTAAGISPSAGMLSNITGTKRFEGHDGTSWAPLPGQMVGYHKRTTNVSFVGSELGIARCNAAMLVGYRYIILTSPLRISAVSGETGKINLRYSTVANAGLTDTVLTSVEANPNTAFTPVQTPTLAATFTPGSNITFSCALTLLRSGGSGNVTLTGSATQPIELFIFCAGPDPGDTGADL